MDVKRQIPWKWLLTFRIILQQIPRKAFVEAFVEAFVKAAELPWKLQKLPWK